MKRLCSFQTSNQQPEGSSSIHTYCCDSLIHGENCLQVGPYDHTVQKPGKGTVLAYWQAEEGLKAADGMKESNQEGGVAGAVGHERHHPARRVDPTGSHAGGLEAEAEADEPSIAPEVTLCSGLQSTCGMLYSHKAFNTGT